MTADQQRTASPPSHADQATPSALADADSTDDSRAAPLARQTLPEAATQPCSKADSAPDVTREKTETYANLLSKAGLDDDEDEDASPMANGEVNNSSRAAAGQSAAEPERGSMLSPSEEAAAHAQVTGADKIPSGQAQPAKQPAGESAAEVLPVAGASSRQPPSEMVKAVKRFVHGQLEPLVQSKVCSCPMCHVSEIPADQLLKASEHLPDSHHRAVGMTATDWMLRVQPPCSVQAMTQQ